MRAPRILPAALLVAMLALAARDANATFIIVNTDGPGEGFNDPTPAAPVGGNTGTTVGQQRLNVFNKAGEIWDRILQSSVPISVRASFDPLPCAPTSGVLGSAGPYVVESDFANAPYAATWFVGAEANRLAGTDLDPANEDIEAQFQSNVGTANCLSSRSWYYGYDGNEGPNGIDLLPVLLHEFGHGLGFLTLTDESDGSEFSGMPTVFDRFLMDNTTGKHWVDMTASERVASAIHTGHLVWDGPAVTGSVPTYLGPREHVTATGAVTGDFASGEGIFYPLPHSPVTGPVVLVNDGVGTTSDGCETPFANAGAIAGKVALLDRSASCSMAQQAANAQSAGAIAAIIVNNVAGPEPPLRGGSPTVAIPVASLSQSDGATIKTALGSGTVTVTLALDAGHRAGADDTGRARMYDPNPDQPGSSVSHYDVSAFPNALMEPSINPDLGENVDLTRAAFADIGWFPGVTAVTNAPLGDRTLSVTPNPAQQGGVLRFTLAASRPVDLTVFDVAGRAVAHLAHRTMDAGTQEVRWSRVGDDGRRVGPGVYLIRLKSGSEQHDVRLVLVD